MKTGGTPLLLSLLREGFASPLASALSLFACLVIGSLTWAASQWLLFEAVWPWQAAAECQQLEGICWPFLIEKMRFILFGTYPYESQARPALVSFLLCLLAFVTGMGVLGRGPKIGARPLAVAWAVVIVLSFIIMGGGVFGLQPVDPVRWNGLPILMMLSIIAVALAFPLGILLALARVQKTYALLSAFAAGYIEIARGVPMLTVLFFGIFVLPLLLPAGFAISPIAATMVALVFFMRPISPRISAAVCFPCRRGRQRRQSRWA